MTFLDRLVCQPEPELELSAFAKVAVRACIEGEIVRINYYNEDKANNLTVLMPDQRELSIVWGRMYRFNARIDQGGVIPVPDHEAEAISDAAGRRARSIVAEEQNAEIRNYAQLIKDYEHYVEVEA